METSKFKSGDKVVVITPGNYRLLKRLKGQVVTVDDIDPHGPWVVLSEDLDKGGYAPHRFRLATPEELARQPEVSSVDTLAETVSPAAKVVPTPGHGTILPDGNPKTRYGMAKPPLSLIPGAARIHLAEAFRNGADKYGPANWREDPVSASTYLNAAERHLVSWIDGEEVAEDSGVHHLAHAAACLLILLDAQEATCLIDDRPRPNRTAALIKDKTKPLIS